jgi:uncharacterized protein (TIGR02145 family)
MKNIMIMAVVAVTSLSLFAQTPEGIRYQSVIRDHDHALLADQRIGVRIILAGDVEARRMLYTETHQLRTSSKGMVNIEIGTGSAEYGNFTDIEWSSRPLYVKTEIDPAGGRAYSLEMVSQIISVPYACYAKTAGIIDELTETQGLGDVLAVNDSAGSQLRAVTDPTENQDAVTLNYFIQQMMLLEGIHAGFPQDIVADKEGNLYRGIRIGDLVWMSENLRTTKFNDGTDIPLVTDQTEWLASTTPAYCWYGNAAGNSYAAVTCGALYNWYAVNTEKLCPADWRVPTEEDWNDLIAELGGLDVAGGKMKEAGTKHWLIPNLADNESGFRALPGGLRYIIFEKVAAEGHWWSSSEIDADMAGGVAVGNAVTFCHWYDGAYASKRIGKSVRCVKDIEDHVLVNPF